MTEQNNYKTYKKNYEKFVFGDIDATTVAAGQPAENCDNDVKKAAYKTVIDTRKFEINLFWQRALFFWGFISVAFIAYWNVFNKAVPENLCIKEIDLLYKLVLLVISSIIFLFCFIFHLANRGSKFWQENWESHITYTEEDVAGKLFSTWFVKKSSVFNPLGKYPYSVSKLAMLVSFIMVIASLLLVDVSIYFLMYEFGIKVFLIIVICSVVGLSGLVWLSSLLKGNKSFWKESKKEEKKLMKETIKIRTVDDKLDKLND